MDVIRDNKFSNDINSVRYERLIAIQGNCESVQLLINAPEHIYNWAKTCFDTYSALCSTQGVESNETPGSTIIVRQKEAFMRENYQLARGFAISIYKSNKDLLKDYGFEVPYPYSRADRIAKVEGVIQTYQEHLALGITPLLPELMINRLTESVNALKEAIKNQAKDISESRHSLSLANERFVHDTQMLNELKFWWFLKMGKDDGRIGLIGMVNRKKGRRKKKVE